MSTKLPRFCVFCGEEPESYSKEHVVPQWLIRLTGNPRRKAFFGLDKRALPKAKYREFAFNRFVFPACDQCNNSYSELEHFAESTLTQILNGKSVQFESLSTLFDWLDKVRVGIWLGVNTLEENFMNIDPNFYINDRIRAADRLMIIQRSDNERPRLNLTAADTPAFGITPSAFGLIVNDLYITNVSSQFLVSRRLGLPFPKETVADPDGTRLRITIGEGRERVNLPILRKKIEEIGSYFLQSIHSSSLMDERSEYYEPEYIRDRFADPKTGVGKICREAGRELTEYSFGEEIGVRPEVKHDFMALEQNFPLQILNWQDWLIDQTPSLELLSPEHKKRMRDRLRFCRLYNAQMRRLIAAQFRG